MPYRGDFKGIEERTARNNKKYHVASIGNDGVSIWDADVAQALQAVPAGTEVEYEFRKSGNYKNLTSWSRPEAAAPADESGPRTNAYIRRMSALKNATRTLDGYTDVSPREKAEMVLKVATKYERYTLAGDMAGKIGAAQAVAHSSGTLAQGATALPGQKVCDTPSGRL